MAIIDGSVVNVALPTMQKALSASAASALWIVNGYLLALGACVLVGGTLADRYGRRRCFVYGAIGFALASAVCGCVTGATALVFARIAQGVSAALLQPASLALLAVAFEGPARSKAIGTWAGVGALMSAVGPVVGGWLVEHASWRIIFLMNLPVAASAVLCARAGLDDTRGDDAKHLDVGGCVSAIACLALITWGLSRVTETGVYDSPVVVALVAGVLSAVTFVIMEARKGSGAMMPLAIFRNRVFMTTNVLTVLLYAGFSIGIFFVPFALIRIGGYDTPRAGAALLPFSVIMFAVSGASGRLAARFGAHWLMFVGPLIASGGFAFMATTAYDGPYVTSIAPAVCIQALGMALTVAPLTTTVMSALDDSKSGLASGVNNAVARIGGLLGIAVAGVVLASVFATSSGGASLTAVMSGEADTQIRAFATAIRATMWLACGLSFASAFFGFAARSQASV